MDLFELLLNYASPALARMLLTKWIGNSDIAEELTGSLRDIISKFTNDRLAQRKAETLFTDIGNDIANSLLKVFNSEGMNIVSERKIVVVRAVIDTLPRVKVSTSLNTILATHDLSSERLCRFLLANFPHKQELDLHEHQLYERVINEACERVIQIAAGLPVFQVRTLAEILKRNRQIQESVTRTMEKVDSLYEDSFSQRASLNMQLKRFEHNYRQAVIWRLDKLELFGLDLEQASNFRQPLSIAYVNLQLLEKNIQRTLPTPQALRSARRVILSGDAGAGKTTLLKWLAVRAANNDFDRHAPELNDWGGSIPFFIRLRDFAKIQTPLPQPETWVSLIAAQIASTMPTNWVHDQLEQGRAIVLLDGLDELSNERRREVSEWIDSIVRSYPKSRYVISSRPAALLGASNFVWVTQLSLPKNIIGKSVDYWGSTSSNNSINVQKLFELLNYTHNLLKAETFNNWSMKYQLSENEIREQAEFFLKPLENYTPSNSQIDIEEIIRSFIAFYETEASSAWKKQVEVKPLDQEGVSLLVKNWHSAVAYAEGLIGQEKESMREMAHHFLHELRNNSVIADLAHSPLLCAMLCALHRERGQDLPTDRISLYRACLVALIDRRDRKRGVDTKDYVKLSPADKYYLLQDMAYWMMRNDYAAAAPKDEIIERLSSQSHRMITSADFSGEQILQLFIERVGIVREPDAGKIDFTHRTFQEFLTAESIVANGDVRSLAPYLLMAEWRETVLLTAGLCNQKDFAWILRKLLTKTIWHVALRIGSLDDSSKRAPHLLALECLTTVTAIDEPSRRELERHLSLVRPPFNLSEAQTFSRAGEIAVPYLGFKKGDIVDESISCIYALSLIGGEKAIEKIEEIVNHYIPETPTGRPTTMPLFLEDREKFESEHRQNIERLIIHVYDLWEIWRFSELYAKRILQPLIIHTNYLMVNRTNCMKSVAKYLDIDELITLEIAEKTCHNPESLDIICSLRSVQTLLVPKTVTLPKCLSQKSDSLFRVVQT